MEKAQSNYVYLMSAGDGLSEEDFGIELYEYNSELCCDGNPKKIVKNFDDFIDFLDEWID